MDKQVLDRLDVLGNKLEKLGSHGYEVLVKQAFIEGVVNLILIIIGLLITVTLITIVCKSYRKCSKEEGTLLFDYETEWFNGKCCTTVGCVVLALLFIFSAIVVLVTINQLPTIIQQIINPEGYIVKSIINNLKG